MWHSTDDSSCEEVVGTLQGYLSRCLNIAVQLTGRDFLTGKGWTSPTVA